MDWACPLRDFLCTCPLLLLILRSWVLDKSLSHIQWRLYLPTFLLSVGLSDLIEMLVSIISIIYGTEFCPTPMTLMSIMTMATSFESNVIKELCELMGIQKVRTSPYHAQTNGQVEWAHQICMHMIRKLSKDQKADLPKHLSELLQVYNSSRSAITRYSPHYLMFGHWLCLPTDFYFHMIRSTEAHWCVDYYTTRLCEWLQEAFKE